MFNGGFCTTKFYSNIPGIKTEETGIKTTLSVFFSGDSVAILTSE